jgi:hypothetical protein
MFKVRFSNISSEVPKENVCIDRDAFSLAEKLWNEYKYLPEGADVEHVVGNSNIIDSFRVLVKRREIPTHDILFLFEKYEMHVNVDGRLDQWVVGFSDVTDTLLNELLA